MTVAVVLGTYNRLAYLQGAIRSVRENAGVEVTFIVVDGGSTDGSREWLAGETDVVLLGQRGPLTGAVKAFNLGFAYAVENNFEYIFHFNDDASLVTPNALHTARKILEVDAGIGEVAFAFDLFKQPFDTVHGKPYGNFGLIRTSAGMAVARAQGDPSGRAFWNPIYRTYGADSEFGAWLWKLGYRVYAAPGLQVKDHNCQDMLRKGNEANNPNRTDSKLFWDRWEDPASLGIIPELAGGKIHLGCGQKRLKGWINVDGIQTPATDVVCDFFEFFRRQPTKSLSRIYWSHGPEHIPPDRLGELFSLMKNALMGKLIVVTIDLEGIFKNRYRSDANGSAWNSALYGEVDSHHHPYLAHRQCFTEVSLSECFATAGFSEIKSWQPEDYTEIKNLNDYGLSCRLVSCFVEGVA